MAKKGQPRSQDDLGRQIAALSPHDRTVASLMVQIEVLAQEAVATCAIEGIPLGLQEARQAAYQRVVGRWLAQQSGTELSTGG